MPSVDTGKLRGEARHLAAGLMEDIDVTQEDWLMCMNPQPMLKFVHGKVSDRKLRLFALACCRRLWPAFGDERIRVAIDVAEQFVDGLETLSKLNNACFSARLAAPEFPGTPEEIWTSACGAFVDQIAGDAVDVAGIVRLLRAVALAQPIGGGVGMFPAEQQQCRLARDVFGNPFRPLPPRPEAIAPLAEEIYTGAWDKMPLLGEWLQEHGYWEIGEHCLDPNNRHVKGCWVIDWVTGLE